MYSAVLLGRLTDILKQNYDLIGWIYLTSLQKPQKPLGLLKQSEEIMLVALSTNEFCLAEGISQ